MADHPTSASPTRERVLLVGVIALVFLMALSVSYLDEDAFISFRVVENFVHGHGLRWNVDERVQVYTNPLWVLGLIAIRFVVPSMASTSYILSVLASTAAVAVIARRLVGQPLVLLLGLTLPLCLSAAFTDYTNSGLENPFLFLFAALFVERLWRDDEGEDREVSWLHLCLFAALSACTRLDNGLLFAPVLTWLGLTHLRTMSWAKVALGFAPLLAWLGFALFYYGAIFPNPKFAKLDAGISRDQYWEAGFAYLKDIMCNDVTTFAGLAAAVVVAVIGALMLARRRLDPRLAKLVMMCVGVALFTAYVVYVGGDQKAGRHWSAPFFVSVATLSLMAERIELGRRQTDMLLACVVLLTLRFGVQPITAEKDTVERRKHDRFAIVRAGGIRDQRFNSSFYETLFGARGGPEEHDWSARGIRAAKKAAAFIERHPDQNYVLIQGGAGKAPFFAGPQVTYIDHLGLADPLLARLPDADGKMKLIGHLGRQVPRGYKHARQTGDLSELDPDLRAYYEPLRLVISGPLFDAERLRTIWKLRTGAYDDALERYRNDGYPELVADAQKKRRERAARRRKAKQAKKTKSR